MRFKDYVKINARESQFNGDEWDEGFGNPMPDMDPERYNGDLVLRNIVHLYSLKGCSRTVTGRFDCSFNEELTSLEGSPVMVGKEYIASHCSIKSLKGVPKRIYGNAVFDHNQLTSLEGSPREVDGNFVVNKNLLTSLEGGPAKVGTSYSCVTNHLTNLKGAPKECSIFNASYNPLTSVEGLPEVINEELMLTYTGLDNLKDIHKYLKSCKMMNLYNSPIKSHVLGLLLINDLQFVSFSDNLKPISNIINKHIRDGAQSVFDCQQELIDAGFKEYAQL